MFNINKLERELTHALRRSNLRSVNIESEKDVLNIVINTMNNICISFKINLDGFNLMVKFAVRISVNKKYNDIIITKNDGTRMNLQTLVASEGGDVKKFRKVTFANNDKYDFRFSNLRIVYIINRSNFLFVKDKSNLKLLEFIPKDGRRGYDKYCYEYIDNTSLVSFIKDDLEIQTIIDSDFVSYRNISKMSPSFITKRKEWRILYDNNPLPCVLLNHKDMFLVIDHIDRNSLNNSKSNLRIVDRSTNGHNKGKLKQNEFIKGVFLSDYRSNRNTPRYAVAYLQLKDLTYQKNFSIEKLGLQQAIEMATKQRRIWNELHNIPEE